MAAVAQQGSHTEAQTALAALYRQAGLLQEASATLDQALKAAGNDEALRAAQAAVLTDLGTALLPPPAREQCALPYSCPEQAVQTTLLLEGCWV